MWTQRPSRRAAATLAAVLLAALAPPAGAGEEPHERLLEQAGALVTVKYVLKVKMSGGADREIDGETTCLLIDAEGLVLCSNTELGGYVSLMSQMMGRGGGFHLTASPREIEVIPAGAGEGLAGRFIARDTERDLAWIQVEGEADEIGAAFGGESFDLGDGVELQAGDRFYRLRRLDEFFGSVPVVSEGVVAAVLEKPRRLLMPAETARGGFGQPVFAADGKLVGVTVIQMPAAEDPIDGMLGGSMSFLSSAAKLQDMVGGLILPAAEIAKATRLARESLAEDEED